MDARWDDFVVGIFLTNLYHIVLDYNNEIIRLLLANQIAYTFRSRDKCTYKGMLVIGFIFHRADIVVWVTRLRSILAVDLNVQLAYHFSLALIRLRFWTPTFLAAIIYVVPFFLYIFQTTKFGLLTVRFSLKNVSKLGQIQTPMRN